VDDVRILRGVPVCVPELVISTTQVCSVEHGNGSIAEQLRTAGSSLGRQVIQAGNEVIIELNEHLTSTLGPYGPPEAPRPPWILITMPTERPRNSCAIRAHGNGQSWCRVVSDGQWNEALNSGNAKCPWSTNCP